MSTKRTGPFKEIYASTTIPGTSAVAMDSFVAQGNAVKLFLTATGAPLTVTISAEIAHDVDGTYFDSADTWEVEFAAAGSAVVNLDGLGLCVGDIVRLSYTAEAADGDLAVWALNYETTATGGGASSLSGSTIGDTAPADAIVTAAIARSSEQTAVDAGDAVNSVATINGEIVTAIYDWTGDYGRTAEQDPISSHHVSTTEADISNGTDGTYAYYVDMDGYRKLGLQLELDGGTAGAGPAGVTATIEVTVQDDGTAAASCTYQDVTNDVFGTTSLNAAPGATASDMWIDNAEKLACVKYVKIKIVADTNANSGDWTIYSKKLY